MKSRLLFFPALAACLTLPGCIFVPPNLFGGSRGPAQVEILEPAEGIWTRNRIAVIDLTGEVTIAEEGGGMFGGSSPGMLVTLRDRLDAAREDRHLKAVILRIDTPGGGVTASDLIHREIMKFREEAEIPVIAMLEDVAASGGTYIAMAAEEIYALPTTLTGSIGVITVLPQLGGLTEKIGVEVQVVKSGANKDLGSPWRELSDQEREIFQEMIDRMYARFLDTIMESRGEKGLTREKLAEFADGRVFDGEQAAEFGLIDGVLYVDEILDRAKELAGIRDAALVSYEYPYTWRGNVYARSASANGGSRGPAMLGGAGDVNLMKLDLGGLKLPGAGPRMLYRWVP